MKLDIEKILKENNLPERCIGCGTCRTQHEGNREIVCPSFLDRSFLDYTLQGRMQVYRALRNGELEWDEDVAEMFSYCTLCGACAEQCYLNDEDAWKPIRAYGAEILQHIRFELQDKNLGPESGEVLIKSMRNNDNPYTGSRKMRTRWTKEFKDTPVKNLNKEDAEVLYYAGCTPAYNSNNRCIAVSTVNVLNKLGIDFGYLYDKEVCCGSTVRRMGVENEFQRVAKKSLETFKDMHENHGVNTIVTACAGCFRCFNKDYPDVEGYEDYIDGIRVMHLIDFLHEKYKAGEWEPEREVNMRVTYHDPCHTGRHLHRYKEGTGDEDQSYSLYDQPRELLSAIPGIDFVEFERIRRDSLCCGAGGGVKTDYPDFAVNTSKRRVDEAEEKNAEAIVSICPFCHTNLNDGARAANKNIPTLDLVQLLDRAL
ncbi:MAG TPA: (Fe-S)-binding protein [Methanomicrobia archaeon]|nr:(Fe-S)-binding protein [Methanomicrobia archaeon]